ncbi:hypothetical protein Q31b_43320 [Novipirellula aureliae]|uniref:Uncharacterized protein n=1 Tax=Novipirellula aureliae TaxID=2527966 RepID=A0A5C6DN08_9BACT|nr:hypothetical protein [Novipirellula aureliae]TWU37544.1 hypothetical protein Q31b_43320 [Novipirellula aureliae]
MMEDAATGACTAEDDTKRGTIGVVRSPVVAASMESAAECPSGDRASGSGAEKTDRDSHQPNETLLYSAFCFSPTVTDASKN